MKRIRSQLRDSIDDLEAASMDLDNDQAPRRKYLFKIDVCGYSQEVDNCLCARLIMAAAALAVICSMWYILIQAWSLKSNAGS